MLMNKSKTSWTGAGAFVSVVGTGIFVLIMYATGNSLLGLPAGIWGIIVSTALYIGVSLATSAPAERADEFVDASKKY